MNKFFIIRVIAAIVVMLTVSNNVQAQAPTGKYNLVSIESEDGNDLKAFFELMGFDLGNFYIEFKDEGKCIIMVALDGNDEAQEGTYKMDGKNIIFSIDNDKLTGTIEDNKITIVQGSEPEDNENVVSMSMKMVFQKK